MQDLICTNRLKAFMINFYPTALKESHCVIYQFLIPRGLVLTWKNGYTLCLEVFMNL